MAYLKQAKTDDEIKKLTVSSVKKAYSELARDYTKMLDGDFAYCHKCNEFIARVNFYTSEEYSSGLFPICKKCLMKMATDYDKKTNLYTDNREKTISTLQFMNLPFYDTLYDSCLSSIKAEVNEKNRATAWQQMITILKSLPQYKDRTWKDSDIEISLENPSETSENSRTIKRAKKRFGPGYTNEDYIFLDEQYQDWVTRYECSSKAQEEIFERLAFKKWEIRNASRKSMPTKDLDKTYQELLGTANIQPRQGSGELAADSQTFGTLIQKYEETRPLPEIDPELQDVDKIGLYIDVFFKGHACKMFGLKNTFSHIYERFMSKYTVEKPHYNEDQNSETVFEKIFGSVTDDE